MGGPPWPIEALLARVRSEGHAALTESLGPLVLVGAPGPSDDEGSWSFATVHAKAGGPPIHLALRPDALVHPLQKRRVTFARVILVGRSESNDVWIDEPTISKLHARVRDVTDDGFTLHDAGSRNGTFVEGERVREETAVSAGDRVRFGSMSFRVERTAELLARIAAELRAGA